MTYTKSIKTIFFIILLLNVYYTFGQSFQKDSIRKNFIQLLERPHSEFNTFIKFDTTVSEVIEKGYIYSELTEKVPFLLYKPIVKKNSKLPIIICLHGTGGNKEYMKENLEKFSSMGFMAIAIDARFHGERANNIVGKSIYTNAITKAWQNKNENTHPLYFDTVYDLWRLIDYLKSRSDVDTTRIGMMGISMGGIETWMAASTNNSIKVTVPIISVQSFKWSLENERWQGRVNSILASHQQAAIDLADSAINKNNITIFWNKLLPGITDQFDCPSMIRLFAPRPLLILNTENDPNCPLPGAEIAILAAKKEYELMGQEKKFNFNIALKQPHVFNEYQQDLMYKFFKKWL